jgi:hypothetical protein
MNTLHQEYQNQNRYRRFPFADHATLVATNGAQLPDDFMVDAMLYPLNLASGIYVSKIDYGTQQITFADTLTSTVYGVATWSSTSTTAYAYTTDTQAVLMGAVTLGEGRKQKNAGILQFTAEATPLVPAAYFGLNQPGVRGFILDDGTRYTGDVTFEGRNGVNVTSYVDERGRSIIEINITGVPETLEDCFDCGVIRSIRVVVDAGATLLASLVGATSGDIGNILALTTPFDLSALCPATAIRDPERRLDPCSGVVDPCGSISFNGDEYEFLLTPIDGTIHIVTPSPPGYDNPLQITTTTDTAAPPDYGKVTQPKGISKEAREKLLTQLFDAVALLGGKLTLGYRH